MANPIIRIKRSSVPGKIPNASQVPLGEIALNTYDGKVFASRNVGIGTTVFVVNPWTVGTGTDTYNTYFTEGNVGIGTTVPSSRLSVNGNVNITGVLTATTLNVGIGTITTLSTTNLTAQQLNVSGVSTISVNSSTDALRITQIGTGNALVVEDSANPDSTPFVVNNSGNVGIGTTIPTSNLHVVGSTLITGIATVNNNLVVNGNTLFADANANRVGIGTTNPSARLSVNGDVSIASTVGIGTIIDIIPYDTLDGGTLSYEASTGQLLSISNNLDSGTVFSVNDFSGSPSLEVIGDGTVSLAPYDTKVGIGSTIPAEKLDVVGNVNISGIITTSAISVGSTLTHTGTTASLNNTTTANTLNLATGATGSGVLKTINVGTNGAAGSRLLVNIGSATAGTASTVVVNSGTNVLIGSATPTGTTSQPLQVTGGAYVSGNLGVGNTNTSFKLEVLGGNARFATGGQGDVLIVHSNLVSTLRAVTNIQLALGANNTEAVRIDLSGNVGIGITNPSNRLHVLANQASGYAATFDNDGNNANRFGIRIQCGVDTGAGTAVAIDDGDGTNQGNITFNAGTVTYGAFTANHDCVIPSYEGEIPYGTLITTNEILYKKRPSGEEMERGILYSAGISTTPYSKRLLGAYSYAYDLDSPVQSGSDLPVHQVLVLGDGHILCCGEKGNIKFGDGITSSSREGIGMKMDKIGMVIGIAQEDVEFEEDEVKLVPVQYGLHQYIPDNIAEILESLI